jgi:hypothetical protein
MVLRKHVHAFLHEPGTSIGISVREKAFTKFDILANRLKHIRCSKDANFGKECTL